MLINLLQDTYKPNPWYFPHNFDIAAKEKVQQLTMRIEKKRKYKYLVHLMTCHAMPFLASSGHNWGAGVVMI